MKKQGMGLKTAIFTTLIVLGRRSFSMKSLDRHARIDFTLDIKWQKYGIRHTERYFINGLNGWRDIQTGDILEKALHLEKGETISIPAVPGDAVPFVEKNKILKLMRMGQSRLTPWDRILPGRFYPQGMITGISGIFKENINPFRVVDRQNDWLVADLNHPMAGIPLTVNIEAGEYSRTGAERGGSCRDWIGQALSGPGMQARHEALPTRFLYRGALEREDPSPDNLFYHTDRFVMHIDRNAHQRICDLYARYVTPGNRVLDLMAGWESHLPEDIEGVKIHGLGMNENELRKNRQLDDFSIQDLNREPALAFPDNWFDLVICSLSVEYLIDPAAVFRETARVLKPGGRFIVTFSNRWFPEKAIRIWKELHDFERMGLVLEYFLETDRFESLETLSSRGYPRPDDDRYAGNLKESDPVFAVCGKAV